MAKFSSGFDSISGAKEYYFTNLFTWHSFEYVVSNFVAGGHKLLDEIEGISTRAADFESGNCKFRILFRDDVGLYAFRIDGDQKDDDKALQFLLDQLPDRK